MTDRLGELERLQRLRETGAISETEFEREKARLLGVSVSPAAAAARSGTPIWLWVLLALIAIALIAALAWLLLGVNQRRGDEDRVEVNVQADTDEQTKAEPVVEERPIRSRPEREQLTAAFRAAFADRTTRPVGDNEYRYAPGGLVWIDQRAVLVSPGTNLQDCHACAGTLAVHYLEPSGNGFRVVGEWLEGGGFDDWGRPPEWRFSNELSSRPMLRTEGGGGGQGIFCSSLSFYEFAPGGPREIVDVKTGFTNRGFNVPGFHDPPTEVEGEMRNIARGRSFDMVYTVQHFARRGDEFVPTRSERLTDGYVRRGDRYVLRSGEPSAPTC